MLKLYLSIYSLFMSSYRPVPLSQACQKFTSSEPNRGGSSIELLTQVQLNE